MVIRSKILRAEDNRTQKKVKDSGGRSKGKAKMHLKLSKRKLKRDYAKAKHEASGKVRCSRKAVRGAEERRMS